MADNDKLENGLVKIQAGQTVENFLKDINENFGKVQVSINGAPTTITISKDPPSGGVDGDIWIQYEE